MNELKNKVNINQLSNDSIKDTGQSPVPFTIQPRAVAIQETEKVEMAQKRPEDVNGFKVRSHSRCSNYDP